MCMTMLPIKASHLLYLQNQLDLITHSITVHPSSHYNQIPTGYLAEQPNRNLPIPHRIFMFEN